MNSDQRADGWWHTRMKGIDHELVERIIVEDGAASFPFLFLVIASSGIATLGLLLNSVAVIIGAMLIAPLMNPIVLFGFAIAKTDVRLGMLSGQALLLGIISALITSAAIVKIAPFIPPSSEILARINPNLFDLGVAIFSGLVAGYAVVHKKIGAIAGVAIATALIPPLATSGYGLATGELSIFKGSLYLFLTNLIAIAFSVAFMAAWYGFGNLHTPRGLLGKTLLAGAILVVLSVPLLNTLKQSVRTTMLSKQVQEVLKKDLKLEDSRLVNLKVGKKGKQGVRIYAQILTTQYDRDIEQKARSALAKSFDGDVDIKIDQVMMGHDQPVDIVAVVDEKSIQAVSKNSEIELMEAAIAAPVMMSDIDSENRTAKFLIGASYKGNISTIRMTEEQLRNEFPYWKIAIFPVPHRFPALQFSEASTELQEENTSVLNDLIWSINRWKIPAVNVVGYTTIDEYRKQKNKLALKRAENIATILQQAGIQTRVIAFPISQNQRAQELEYGQALFRRVVIAPEMNAPTLD